MKFEYTGWDDYVNLKRTDEQYQQIKKEWKGAVNDYFGITIPPEEFRTPTVAHMKQIEFQMSKLRNDIYTIHTRINQITDCGHGKLKQMITPLHQGNVIGRIEALEEWRSALPDKMLERFVLKSELTELQKRVRELEDNEKAYHEASMTAWNNKHEDRILKLEEWRQGHQNNWHGKDAVDAIHEFNSKIQVIDKKAWEQISQFLTHITGEHSKGIPRYNIIHSITGIPLYPEWIKKINKIVEEQDK